jgi:cell division GTPase FtsZ
VRTRRVEDSVKPAGKAIEIVAVGLGQAGGNLAAEVARRGYRAIALNTATTDLSSLSKSGLSLPEDQRIYIGIDGYDGAGSDQGYGRECITVNAGKIRERVSEHAAGADVVLITAGLGGGTGSAVGELVKILSDLSLPILVLATLPNDHESGIAKVNAVRAINELVKENLLGWVFVDNSRLAKNHGDVAFGKYYTEINKLILEPIDALNRLNSRDEITAIRSLDGEDFRTLLLSGGILSFSTTTLPRLSADTVLQAVREGALRSSVNPEGFQLENVSYMGVVIEAPDAMLADTPYTFFEHINEQLKDETGGAAIHMGVYRLNDKSAPATLRVFFSSQALPEGIQEMVTQAKREGGQLRAKLQRGLSGLDLGEIEEYELFRTSPGTIRKRVTESSSGDIPSRLPPKPAPRPAVQRPTPAAQVAARPTASIPPPSSASMPDRDAYDQLVREFKDSGSDDVKKRVTERLEKDQKSDNSLIRYYAVRAMSKLDSEIFAQALQAATQDEDATVRAVAMKALGRS